MDNEGMNSINRIIRKIPKYVSAKVDNFFVYHVSKYSPELATKEHYRKITKKKLHLTPPQDFNEKLQWLKLNTYYNNPLVKQCADKYRVREYVEEKGCGEILNELYGAWDRPEEIDWEKLPNQFVLKCNHGSGYNYVCTDKSKLDIAEITRTLNEWISEEYGQKHIELIYDGIKPKIICEKYILPEDGVAPKDIKIFCSYGVPKFVYVMSGNDDYQDFLTPQWELLPIQNGLRPNLPEVMPKPDNWDEMLHYASVLADDLPIVRVDFYNESNQIIFGELTFLTTGGMTHYVPEKWNRLLGDMFDISEEIRKKG